MKKDTLLTVQSEVLGDEVELIPDSWEDVRQVFAKVLPIGGREYYQAQQVDASVSHRVLSEYFEGFNPAMRLIRPNINDPENPLRTFNVKSVVNVGERNRELEWMCEEVV